MRALQTTCTCLAVLAVLGCQGPVGAPARDESTPPVDLHALGPPEHSFRGFDLTTAPRTTRPSDLPDLWEERPKGSSSFEMRDDVTCVYSGLDAEFGVAVYHLPHKNRFYIQRDPPESSTMTFYGPFQGDPHTVLNLDTPTPANPPLQHTAPPLTRAPPTTPKASLDNR